MKINYSFWIEMTYLKISLLLCNAFGVWLVSSQQHNSFYGNCTPVNSSEAIYWEVINIRNSGIIQRPPRPMRRFLNSIRDIFRPRNSTTVAPNLNGVHISQIFTYPSDVSTENVRRNFSVLHEHLWLIRRVSAMCIRLSAFESSINS